MANRVLDDITNDVSNDIFKFPLTLGGNDNQYPHYVTFTQRKSYTTTAGGRRGTPGGSVSLYMPPDALKTSYSQSYGDIDMGAAIGIATSDRDLTAVGETFAGGNIEDTAAAIGNILGNVTGGSLLDVATTELGQAATTVFSARAGSVKQAIERASGRILNPHKAVIYQGPGGFRTFSYSFSMTPKNANESDQIKGIVIFFKKSMHPGVGGTGGDINSISSHTLTYPDEFEIKYFVNGRENDSLFRIKPCFLESFSVDYTTSSLPVFIKDGQPQTTNISLTFKETQLLTKKDVGERNGRVGGY